MVGDGKIFVSEIQETMGQEELKKGGRAQLTNLITANKKYTWIHC
jgi:hypothetical protein